MEDLKLCESEYRFMQIIWDHAPMTSRHLVELCACRLTFAFPTPAEHLDYLRGRSFQLPELPFSLDQI